MTLITSQCMQLVRQFSDGTKNPYFHRTFRTPQDLSDVPVLHILEFAHDDYLTMVGGDGRKCFPEGRNLICRFNHFFRPRTLVGEFLLITNRPDNGIFLAVMVTDILLLDAYNTIGLPTSTTVSIVFELLGAAVAMGAIKIIASVPHITLLMMMSTFSPIGRSLQSSSLNLFSYGMCFI